MYINVYIYSCIDNAHTPTSGRARKYRQRAEEFLESACVADSNSSNIRSVKEFLGFEYFHVQ
jgi:hypothetical protein